MIFAFYSYKGGVGRSMALANIGEWLYQRGARVVLIDWDLEAPGLETFFYRKQEELDKIRAREGVLDLFSTYRKLYRRAATGGADKPLDEALSKLGPIQEFLLEVHSPADADSPGLWLLTAGNRAEEHFDDYADALGNFDWSDFLLTYEGEEFLRVLAGQLARRKGDESNSASLADVVLIDSRTGLTEMGGICTQYLADTVVSFCAPNSQNLRGVLNISQSVRREEVEQARSEGAPHVIVVPSRVELSELEIRNKWKDEFEREVRKFELEPPSFTDRGWSFWGLKIPYVPRFAFGEALTFGPNRVSAEELSEAYERLGTALIVLAAEEGMLRPELAAAFESDLSPREFDIQEVLARHQLWLDTDGQRGRQADLSDKDLSGSILIGSNLKEALLVRTLLPRADLRRSLLDDADLLQAQLSGCDLSDTSLVRAHLESANLSGATLDGADLHEANLRGTDLRRASLKRCDLSGANLKGAIIDGTDFEGAIGLEKENLIEETRGDDTKKQRQPEVSAGDDGLRIITTYRQVAQEILRGKGGDSSNLLQLAENLKRGNEFGYARRVLERAREQSVTDPKLRRKLVQKHCLCTYKDPDLPVHDRLERALEILQTDENLKETTDQESLGLAGAIYKRRWQVDSDKSHLERSLSYYLRGYRQGPEKDSGYTGINAAYIQDLLASIEESGAEETGSTSTDADTRRSEARSIRRKLVEVLGPSAAKRGSTKWWIAATVAEAYLGLGDFEQAIDFVKLAKEGSDPPAQWELESTATQLASLAQLLPNSPKEFRQLRRTLAWRVVDELLDGRGAAVHTAFTGKFGLALSGGGFRASLFHIGVLARLADMDMLRHVHVLSCVSGGSIVGAHYYLLLRKLLEEKRDDELTRDSYLDLVQTLKAQFMRGVSANLRMRIGSNLIKNIRMAFSSTYSRTQRLGELYEDTLYAAADDQRDGKSWINKLQINPEGHDAGEKFNPKRDNWLRYNKVPMLVLNATTLNTGHNWQFTSTWMGESPFSIDPEVDGNWRYRRMYYSEAPAPYKKFRLGLAVGASSCVPGLFEPVTLTNLYPDAESPYPEMTVRLVDGGVHDNQGIASLLEQDCNAILVSDASGQMMSDPEPGGGVFAPLLRSNTSLMERVRQLQFFDLNARKRAGLLKSLTVLHLKKGLDSDPVSWRWCKEPPDAPRHRRGDLLEYGVSTRVQESLAAIRTDLDAFSEVEAHSLMASGYLMAEHYASEITNFPRADDEPHQWDFLDVVPALKREEEPNKQKRFERLLDIGKQRALKVVFMSRTLTVVFSVLMVALLGWVGWSLFQEPQPSFLQMGLTVRDVGFMLVYAIIGILLGKGIAQLVDYKGTLRQFMVDFVVAFGGFLVSHLYLIFLNPIFLGLGRVKRVLGETKGEA